MTFRLCVFLRQQWQTETEDSTGHVINTLYPVNAYLLLLLLLFTVLFEDLLRETAEH